MGHDKNDELRDDRREQDEHRQELRDEVLGSDEAATGDIGSQDERRDEGDRRH